MSTTNHPESDGQTERVLGDMLRSFCTLQPKSWSKALPMLEFAVNNSVHASTGFTPFYLNYFRHPRIPANLWRSPRLSGGESRFTTSTSSINHVDNLNINDPISKTSCSINTIADDSLSSDIKCLKIISQVLPEYVNFEEEINSSFALDNSNARSVVVSNNHNNTSCERQKFNIVSNEYNTLDINNVQATKLNKKVSLSTDTIRNTKNVIDNDNKLSLSNKMIHGDNDMDTVDKIYVNMNAISHASSFPEESVSNAYLSQDVPLDKINLYVDDVSNSDIDVEALNNVVNKIVSPFIMEREVMLRRARDAIALALDKQKENADKRGRKQCIKFKIGDKVLLSTKSLPTYAIGSSSTNKLKPRFIGPFAILREQGNTYTIDIPSSMKLHPTFYVGLLKPYQTYPNSLAQGIAGRDPSPQMVDTLDNEDDTLVSDADVLVPALSRDA